MSPFAIYEIFDIQVQSIITMNSFIQQTFPVALSLVLGI